DADGLNISLFAETGGDDAAKPTFAETAGIGAHPMDDFDDGLGQGAEVVVRAPDRGWRQRLFAPPTESACNGMADLSGDRDPLAAVPPSPGAADPVPGAGVRGRQIVTDLDWRGGIKLAHRRFLRWVYDRERCQPSDQLLTPPIKRLIECKLQNYLAVDRH